MIITYNDIIACVVVYFISILSILAGIGGGALYTSVLLLIYNFDITQVVPISVVLIFSSSFINMISFLIKKKHKTNYPILLILIPFLSGASFIGTILLKIMPKIITILCIIISTLFSVCKSFFKLKSELEKEHIQHNINKYVNTPNYENELTDLELQNVQNRHIMDIVKETIEEPDNCIDNKEIQSKNFKKILLYLSILLIVVICEGSFSVGRKYMEPCSYNYIYICVGQVIFTIIVAISVYWFLLHDQQTLSNNCEDIKLTPKNFGVLWFVGGFTSIISSWSSIGGAMIINPILFSFKLSPSSVVETGCNFIWFGSLSSIANYIINNQIESKYSIMLSICTIFGSLTGQLIYDHITIKIKKQSILVVFLLVVAVLSLVMILVSSIITGGLDDFKIKNLCEV